MPRRRLDWSGDSCADHGCDREPYARGLCNAHYIRLVRDGDPDLDRPIGVPRASLVPTKFGICADNGCDQPVKTRGLCQLHHRRWLRHGDPEFDRPRGRSRDPLTVEAGTCRDNGCDQDSRARGLCTTHYQRWLAHGDPDFDWPIGAPPKQSSNVTSFGTCADHGCDRDPDCRGLCGPHYRRWLADGDPDFVRPIGTPRPQTNMGRTQHGTCPDNGCPRPVRSLGLCDSHYRRYKTHGDPDFDRPFRHGVRPTTTASQADSDSEDA